MRRYIHCPLELTDLTESSVAGEAGGAGGGLLKSQRFNAYLSLLIPLPTILRKPDYWS